MEEKKEDGSCGKGGCGIRCGCCACKAIKALVLLLVGGIVGYCVGHCRGPRMCAMPMAPAMQSESAPTPVMPPHKGK